jgi:hypothetical protein
LSYRAFALFNLTKDLTMTKPLNNNGRNISKPAAKINLPSNAWVKLIALQALEHPDMSRAGVVLHLIDTAHKDMLQGLGEFLHGGTPEGRVAL